MFYFVLLSLGCKILCLSKDDDLYILKMGNYFNRKYNIVSDTTKERRHEKTCLQGLRPGKTQTSQLSYRN